MQPIIRPRIKICCIKSAAEAATAVAYGASALGLVSSMPSGPGVIDEETITAIAATVPPGVATFLLTSAGDVADIIRQQKRCGVNTIQICDALTKGTHAELKAALPGVSIVQVIHVTGEASVREAVATAPHVDALLLDSGNPNLAVKELGGTGRIHNWEYSRQIREQIDKPLFLAGGLRAANVGDAIHQVGPFGLDLCSGVRTDDVLNEAKLKAFFQAVREAA